MFSDITEDLKRITQPGIRKKLHIRHKYTWKTLHRTSTSSSGAPVPPFDIQNSDCATVYHPYDFRAGTILQCTEYKYSTKRTVLFDIMIPVFWFV